MHKVPFIPLFHLRNFAYLIKARNSLEFLWAVSQTRPSRFSVNMETHFPSLHEFVMRRCCHLPAQRAHSFTFYRMPGWAPDLCWCDKVDTTKFLNKLIPTNAESVSSCSVVQLRLGLRILLSESCGRYKMKLCFDLLMSEGDRIKLILCTLLRGRIIE